MTWDWSDTDGLSIKTFGGGQLRTTMLKGIHQPYFYVEKPNMILDLEYESTDVVPHDGSLPLYRALAQRPSQVKDLREKFHQTYEADIPYQRRLAVDDVIRYTYDVVTYYDIEVASNNMLLCIGCHSRMRKGEVTVENKTCFKLNRNTEYRREMENRVADKIDDRHTSTSDREMEKKWQEQIIDEFLQFIKSTKTDVLVGWNNLKYDKPVLAGFMTPEQREVFEAIPQVDLMWEYKKKRHPARMSLDFAGTREGFGGKIEDVDRKHLERISPEALERYNMRDVELLIKIDMKYGLVDLVCGLSELAGIGVEEESAMRIVDAMLLKKAREKKWALPTTPPRKKQDEEVEGATVFNAPKEVCEDVSVFDFESLYPNIILNEQIGPAIIREVLAEGLERRREWAKDYKATRKVSSKVKSDAYKVVNNSMYGVMGNIYFRLYNIEDQARVTKGGRERLKEVADAVALYGFQAIYGDTDSIFVQCGDIDDARALEVKLNRMLYPYSLKFEKYYKRLIFPGGAKKRYAGHIVWEKGKVVDDIDVTGLEAVRMDWCDLAKEVQMDVIEDVLRRGLSREQIATKLLAIQKKLYTHGYDDKLIVTKSIEPDRTYSTNLPQVRAYAILRAKKGSIEGDRIEYVYVRKSQSTSDVYPLLEGWESMLDYDWYWEHQVKAVVNRIIDVAFPSRMSLEDFVEAG